MSSEEENGSAGSSIRRRSSRPSVFKIMDAECLSEYFGVSMSSSESSDQEFTPFNATIHSSSDRSESSSNEEISSSEEEEEDDKEEEEEEDSEKEKQQDEKLINNEHEMNILSSSITPTAGTINSDYNDPICCVCLETARNHDIVTCDGCGLSVHEGCYGVPESDDADDNRSDISSFSTIPWFCDLCKADVINPSCELCPVLGGLFKQSINGSWVHALCGLYCEGVEYIEPHILSGLTLDEIPPSKWGAKSCQLCEEEWMSHTGVCIKCDAGMCRVFFHATCGQKNGLLCEADDTSDTSSDKGTKIIADPYFAHCQAHCDKKLTRKKKAKYAKMIQNIKQFKRQDDNRLKKYLSHAKSTYISQYTSMKEWYHPDKVTKKGQRLLHNHPEAFKMLSEKAQLFGHALPKQPYQQSTSRTIVPVGLTEDYVKFFNDREVKLSSVKSENDNLMFTLKQLKDKSQNIQDAKKQVETNLQSVKVDCLHTVESINHICGLVNQVAGKEVLDATKYITIDFNEETNNHTDSNETLVCCICNESNEIHLMTQCDTCKKLYHISCLDPPLTRVPVKSSRLGWECEDCGIDSDDKLKPAVPMEMERQSRFGRKLNQSNNHHDWVYITEFSQPKRARKKK